MEQLRAAVYCRISKAKDGKRKSVEDQQLDCRDLCEINGWKVVEPPFVDDSVTAADPNKERPAYDAMMKAVPASSPGWTRGGPAPYGDDPAPVRTPGERSPLP